ncbi:translation initiation factor IF-2-like [Microtus oregoni]|uniref:translation initiation factor IF-2-like n=1 Tax=Microtus oregoni TaxID=111838 RepID=UPI001BB18421|nr:translation initiation factor IF-2-like [Microtus oregoni]
MALSAATSWPGTRGAAQRAGPGPRAALGWRGGLWSPRPPYPGDGLNGGWRAASPYTEPGAGGEGRARGWRRSLARLRLLLPGLPPLLRRGARPAAPRPGPAPAPAPAARPGTPPRASGRGRGRGGAAGRPRPQSHLPAGGRQAHSGHQFCPPSSLPLLQPTRKDGLGPCASRKYFIYKWQIGSGRRVFQSRCVSHSRSPEASFMNGHSAPRLCKVFQEQGLPPGPASGENVNPILFGNPGNCLRILQYPSKSLHD